MDGNKPGRARKAGVPIVRAVERSIALLRAFTADRSRQTLAELAKATSLDKNTARRLLHTLEAGALIEHREGQYSLSHGLLDLFSAVDTAKELRQVAAPILQKIADQTSATAFLWLYQQGMAVCVERARASNSRIEVTWSAVGSRTTLNSGGGPLALLGFLPPKEADVSVNQVLVSRTPFSITDPKALFDRRAQIARDGYVLCKNDYVVGLSAIGVPVLDRHGQLLGALSVSSLNEHIEALVGEGYVETLRAHSRLLGNTAPN